MQGRAEALQVPLRESYEATDCSSAGAEAQSLIIDTCADRWRWSGSTVSAACFCFFGLFVNTAGFIYPPVLQGR